MNRFRAWFWIAFGLSWLLLCGQSVHAENRDAGLPDGMARLAEAVDEYFKKEGHDKVVVLGSFTSQGGDGNTQLRLLLQENLKKAGFEIKARTKFSISGRFLKEFRSDGVSDAVALKVKAEIRDSESDNVVQAIAIPIFGDQAVAILGPTADLPTSGPKGEEPQRQKNLNDSFDKPQVTIVGSETRASSSSPFGIEILVGRNSRKPNSADGQAFVALSKGEEYIVRFHNHATFEAAVSLTIDGLTMFAFSEEGNFGSQVLVPAGGSIDIPGWYINKERSDAFEITTFSKGAAAIKGVTGSVGVITASFSAAWDPKSNPPADELTTKSADSATGKGRSIGKRYEVVQRVVGRVRAFVSVRYNR